MCFFAARIVTMLDRKCHRVALCAAAAGLTLFASQAANAITCYTLFDRNDNVVYRDTISPVDLSDQGTAGRASLQQRGEFLMISEADRCPQVAFVFGTAGTTALSTDEFLNGIQSARTPRAGGPARSPGVSTPAQSSVRTAPASAK
jgi:hypothetical protein